MLTRDTDWRQGDLLTQETAARLTALNCTAGEGHRVVVITPLADLRRVDQWRLEYISLSDDDHGDFLPVAGTPV